MTNKILKEKLKEINKTIISQWSNEKNLGVLAGLSSLSLFIFYYERYIIGKYDNIGYEIIAESINRMNNGYFDASYGTGIAGMGWMIDHLEKEEFIEVDADSILSEVDSYLYNQLIKEISIGNFDFLHGAIGCGYYFLNRFKSTKSNVLNSRYRDILVQLVQKLKVISITDEHGAIMWQTKLNDKFTYRFDLGLSHGVSSIIAFLSELKKVDILDNNSEKLLNGAIDYVLSKKVVNNNSFSLFSNWVSEGDEEKKSRLAWCYGDLGIGIALLNASMATNRNDVKDIAIEILMHASKRRTYDETWVNEVTLCHGSLGVSLIFNRAYKKTGIIAFQNASKYWFKDGIKKIENKRLTMNKDKKEKKTSAVDLSIIEGLSGVGLSIIDYLVDDNLTWDECLQIR